MDKDQLLNSVKFLEALSNKVKLDLPLEEVTKIILRKEKAVIELKSFIEIQLNTPDSEEDA